jgi:hypothetical protein
MWVTVVVSTLNRNRNILTVTAFNDKL